MSATDLEAEALELVLHLDAEGRGAEAFRLYQECMSRAVRPLLLRQREALKSQGEAEDAMAMVQGCGWLEAATDPVLAASGVQAIQEVMAHDAGLECEWEALIAKLREMGT